MSRDSLANRAFGLKCPDCKQPILEKDLFCPHCGANLDAPIEQTEDQNLVPGLNCPACKQPVSQDDLYCPYCGVKLEKQARAIAEAAAPPLPIQPNKGMAGMNAPIAPAAGPARPTTPKDPNQVLGGSKELNEYVLTADGISRTALNIMCFIGVFIFGWLLAMAFQSMGKKNTGWWYVGPIIACLVISRFGGDTASLLGIAALVLYAIGWIHANLVLSEIQSDASKRIAEIDQQSPGFKSVDSLLEKGILQSKVLGEKEMAQTTFAMAAQLPGGNPKLLNIAGVTLFANKRYALAKPLFDRALSLATDEALIKQIKINQANVQKKLK